MGTFFLSKVPLINAATAKKAVALTACEWFLYNVLANKTFEVILKIIQGLTTIDIALLQGYFSHLGKVTIDTSWLPILKFIFKMLEVQLELLVESFNLGFNCLLALRSNLVHKKILSIIKLSSI